MNRPPKTTRRLVLKAASATAASLAMAGCKRGADGHIAASPITPSGTHTMQDPMIQNVYDIGMHKNSELNPHANASLILPGQPEWFIPQSEDFEITSFAATAPDKFGFGVTVTGDIRDLSDPYTRVYRSDAGRWVCAEIEAHIFSMAPFQSHGKVQAGIAMLEREGVIWYPGCDLPDEQIEDAGVSEGTNVKKGYVNTIRSFQDELFVCGMDGQFYRRRNGTWEHDDAGMLEVVPDFPRKRPGDEGRYANIYSVVTSDGRDFYACGTLAIARPALYWRPEGEAQWRWIQIDASSPRYDFMMLLSLHAASRDDIWFTTNKSIQFRGNGRDGFKEIPPIARINGQPVYISNFMSYEGELYAGGERCYRRVGENRWEEVTGPPAKSVYASDPQDHHINGALHLGGGCLWAVGYRGISRFDGKTWERIEIPPVYKKAK